MNNGWISLYRQFLEWEWYDDVNTKSLFLHLLLIANHKDAKWRGKDILRGQTFTSIKNLSNALNLSEKQVRTSLKRLQKTGEISSSGANNGTLISVIKYDTYQTQELPKVKRKANKGQSKVKQLATNNNDNKNKKKNNLDVDIYSKVYTDKNLDKYGKKLLDSFYSYWTEPLLKNGNPRWTDEKSFEVQRRVVGWATNDYDGHLKEHKDEKFRQEQSKSSMEKVDLSEVDPEGQAEYMTNLSNELTNKWRA